MTEQEQKDAKVAFDSKLDQLRAYAKDLKFENLVIICTYKGHSGITRSIKNFEIGEIMPIVERLDDESKILKLKIVEAIISHNEKDDDED